MVQQDLALEMADNQAEFCPSYTPNVYELYDISRNNGIVQRVGSGTETEAAAAARGLRRRLRHGRGRPCGKPGMPADHNSEVD